MLFQIIINTPTWVWILLAALIGLGLSQTVTRQATIKRVTIIPIALMIFSLYGTVSTFGLRPLALFAWLCAAALSLVLWLRLAPSSPSRFDSQTQVFTIAGSWVPMGLILGLFITKYVAGVEVAMNPTLSKDLEFAIGFSALFGVFSGVFIARAVQVLRLTKMNGSLTLTTIVSG